MEEQLLRSVTLSNFTSKRIHLFKFSKNEARSTTKVAFLLSLFTITEQ